MAINGCCPGKGKRTFLCAFLFFEGLLCHHVVVFWPDDGVPADLAGVLDVVVGRWRVQEYVLPALFGGGVCSFTLACLWVWLYTPLCWGICACIWRTD